MLPQYHSLFNEIAGFQTDANLYKIHETGKFIHIRLLFMVNVGKYSSPMGHVGTVW